MVYSQHPPPTAPQHCCALAFPARLSRKKKKKLLIIIDISLFRFNAMRNRCGKAHPFPVRAARLLRAQRQAQTQAQHFCRWSKKAAQATNGKILVNENAWWSSCCSFAIERCAREKLGENFIRERTVRCPKKYHRSFGKFSTNFKWFSEGMKINYTSMRGKRVVKTHWLHVITIKRQIFYFYLAWRCVINALTTPNVLAMANGLTNSVTATIQGMTKLFRGYKDCWWWGDEVRGRVGK